MAARSSFSTGSFQKALDSFRSKSGLTLQELKDMEMTTLPDLQRALNALQTKQQGSKTMRHLRRVQPFLDAMEQYSKVVNIFANTSSLVAFIWGPMKFLLITASNFADAFNALLEGYLRIGENIPLLFQYQQLFMDNQYMQAALTSIFEDILDYHLEAVKLFKQKTWIQLFHATSRSLNRRIDEIAKSMQSHKNIIEGQVSLIAYEEFQASHEYMKAEFAALRSSERQSRHARVQEWLCAIDSSSRNEAASRDRFSDSGLWLLQHDRFKAWFELNRCSDPLLWLHGIPGAGKTVLASLVVEEARKLVGVTIVYFYCRYTDDQRSGFLGVARSLISQVLSSDDTVLDYLYEAKSKSGEVVLSTVALVKGLLEVVLKSCKTVYIVLDGLDEYSRDTRRELTAWFQQLVAGIPRADFGSIRCLFISQEDGYARKDLSMLSQIKITPTETRDDIQNFCKYWHQQIELKFGPFKKREHDVMNVVSARAQGMFLYAKLVTWNLNEQPSPRDFEAEMDEDRLPVGLDQAYDRILDRLDGPTVPESRSASIRRLLGWLACARRPLKWHEIQGAVAVNSTEAAFVTQQQFREDCKDLCASLVEIAPDQTVTLVHSTTRPYLVRKKSINIPAIEYDMATLCTTFLSMQEFEVNLAESAIEEACLSGVYAFTDYAACFWALHLEAALADIGEDGSHRLELLSECLEGYLDVHWAMTGKIGTIPDKVHQHLKVLEQHDYYERACQAVATAKSWLRPTAKAPIEDGVFHLPRVIERVRAVLERISSSQIISQENQDFLLQHYGPNHYKCAKMNCQFFHQGFVDKEQREQHSAKHDRSFTCTWYGCPYEIIGFSTTRDLQNHVFGFHGIKAEMSELEFPKVVTPGRSKQVAPSRFRCPLCPKKFTRAHNLRIHQRSHTDERPFNCTICGKGFARQHDWVRHERGHDDGKKFICKGDLRAHHRQWGCGRRFSRAETLNQHFRSVTGRECIKDLLDEQREERELEELLRPDDQQHGDQTTQFPFKEMPLSSLSDFDPPKDVPSNSDLLDICDLMPPKALLEQYPELRDMDWSALIDQTVMTPSESQELIYDPYDTSMLADTGSPQYQWPLEE